MCEQRKVPTAVINDHVVSYDPLRTAQLTDHPLHEHVQKPREAGPRAMVTLIRNRLHHRAIRHRIDRYPKTRVIRDRTHRLSPEFGPRWRFRIKNEINRVCLPVNMKPVTGYARLRGIHSHPPSAHWRIENDGGFRR